MKYFVLAFYHFTEIENPKHEVGNHKRFFKNRDVTSRIYISEEGINGQMSASEVDAIDYMNWMKSDPRFSDIDFKIHESEEQAFPKVTVKYRKELVAMGEKVDITKGGEHLSPAKWKEMLENKDENTVLIDVRNDYEWKVGHFEGAELPDLHVFRDFPKYARNLKKVKDPKKTKVMMYCTGGIRCEVYSALMKEEGFSNVYQLDGGVIKYGLEEGAKHWRGKLFVFDDRMVVPISKDNNETLSECQFCGVKTDKYYNCANMDCNDLFIACEKCAHDNHGCCSNSCHEHGRVRPFSGTTKPYRKLPKEVKERINH